MKRILSLLLIISICFCVVGCNKIAKSDSSGLSSIVAQTETSSIESETENTPTEETKVSNEDKTNNASKTNREESKTNSSSNSLNSSVISNNSSSNLTSNSEFSILGEWVSIANKEKICFYENGTCDFNGKEKIKYEYSPKNNTILIYYGVVISLNIYDGEYFKLGIPDGYEYVREKNYSKAHTDFFNKKLAEYTNGRQRITTNEEFSINNGIKLKIKGTRTEKRSEYVLEKDKIIDYSYLYLIIEVKNTTNKSIDLSKINCNFEVQTITSYSRECNVADRIVNNDIVPANSAITIEINITENFKDLIKKSSESFDEPMVFMCIGNDYFLLISDIIK